MMNYEEALEKIHEFNVFGSRLGLERMKKLLSVLGNPHEGMKIIHVAGTNGKGSVCRYIYTVLSECGYRTGAYFSPYLEEFTERIECGGRQIGRNELPVYTERALRAVESMIAEGFETPTEFELVTAIGLLYFKERKADFVILEVGLGGRGDSTNICGRPVAEVITSISYDHMNVLGNTLEEIAYDKAGIIKPGVPVSVFAEDSGAFAVIKKQADELEAPVIDLTMAETDVKYCGIKGSRFSADISPALPAAFREAPEDVCSCRSHEAETVFKDIEISMPGRHQINNAVCALSAIYAMRRSGYVIPESCLLSGMKKAVQPGRFEVVSDSPLIILDGAHNRAGVSALTETLLEEFSGRKILLCTGMLADKEVDVMTSVLARLDADVITVSVPNPRRMAAGELASEFRKLEPYRSGRRSVTAADDTHDAVILSERMRDGYDVTVWAGSLYLIGAVRKEIRERLSC